MGSQIISLSHVKQFNQINVYHSINQNDDSPHITDDTIVCLSRVKPSKTRKTVERDYLIFVNMVHPSPSTLYNRLHNSETIYSTTSTNRWIPYCIHVTSLFMGRSSLYNVSLHIVIDLIFFGRYLTFFDTFSFAVSYM